MSKSTLKDQCQEPTLRITVVEETSQKYLTFRCYFLFLAHDFFRGDLVWRFYVVILSRIFYVVILSGMTALLPPITLAVLG